MEHTTITRMRNGASLSYSLGSHHIAIVDYEWQWANFLGMPTVVRYRDESVEDFIKRIEEQVSKWVSNAGLPSIQYRDI